MATAPQSRPPKLAAKSPAAMEVEWITNDLVARTQATWGRHLRRRVTRDEAVEMLLNVQGLAMAFHLASVEGEAAK